MRSDNEGRGLCTNCKNAPHCTFPRDPDKPVMQCEEFVCDGPRPARIAVGETSRPIIPEDCITS